ncbi:MAG: FecR family protein [Pseudohongiellaceae bacterium]
MTTHYFVTFVKILSQSLCLCILVAAGFVGQTANAETPASGDKNSLQGVGTVTLVLGAAYLESPTKARKKIRVGTQMHAGDLVSTAINGYVHIEFIDDAYLSIRPDSQLEIVSYQYNQEHPELSAIKLNLLEGVSRSISGEATKAARHRFRLNTPIVAIGVRGTDFVVSASQQGVRALVNQGVIVMAPYSSDCTADSFGPCNSNAVELTENSLQIIEFDSNTSLPRLLPAPHEREPGAMRDEVQQALTDNEDAAEEKTSGTGVYVEAEAAKKLSNDIASAVPAPTPKPVPPPTPPPTPTPTPTPPPTPAPTPTPPPDYTPAASVPAAVLSNRQLVWGRYSEGVNDQERITLSLTEASAGREVAIGNYDYALFRVEGKNASLDPGLNGPISFTLDSAQAYYNSASGVLAMQVNGGSLDIDFTQNLFATELRLSSTPTGNVNFTADGRLFDGGYFHSRTDQQRIAGAVSLEGKEAGYFFERQLESGSIQGLTLWNRPGL